MLGWFTGRRKQAITQATRQRDREAARNHFLGEMVTSRLILGGSGSGKSTAVVGDLVEVAEMGDWCIIVMDGHGPTAQQVFLHLINRGMAHRVLYDQLNKFDRVLAGFSLEQSTDPNPFVRESENAECLMAMADIIWGASQREEKLYTMPAMSEQLDLFLRIGMFQNTPVPLAHLQYLTQLTHPLCQRLVDNCTDREAAEQWRERIQLAKRNSSTLLEQKIGPLQRLIRTTFNLPAFRERCEGHFNLYEAMVNKQIIFLDGSGVMKQAATAVYRMTNLQVRQILQRHFAATGRPLYILLLWEECADYSIISTHVELPFLLADRKRGGRGWAVSQHARFVSDDIRQALFACTPQHDDFNPMDPELAMLMAEDLAYGKLNPHRIKHVHETEEFGLVGTKTITRKSTTKSEHGTSETEMEIQQPEYDKVTKRREETMPFSEQILDYARMLMTMPVGSYMRRTRTYTSEQPEHYEMLPDPWPAKHFPWRDPVNGIYTLAEKKLRDAIAKSQQRPEFKTPTPVDSSQWTAAITPDSASTEITTQQNGSTFMQLPMNNNGRQVFTPPSKRRGRGKRKGR